MNCYQKGKTEVTINGNFVGYATGVSIDRSSGSQKVNISIEGVIKNPKTDKVISQQENYDNFFKKFAKAFNKE